MQKLSHYFNVIPLFKLITIRENFCIAFHPCLSKYDKAFTSYRTFVFHRNYLVRKHITERQVICPSSLQSHEGKAPGIQ